MATIVMSADKVIEAAKNILSEIEASRDSDNEAMIKYRIESSIPGKFRAFLGCKPISRDQAVKSLINDTWGFYPSIKGWGIKAHAEKLLILARHGDPVTLTHEDTAVLFN